MDDLTCQEVVEMITGFLEGGVDDPTRLRFERHLAGCLGCGEYLEQMRRTVGELSRLPDPPLSASTRRVLLEALRASIEGRAAHER